MNTFYEANEKIPCGDMLPLYVVIILFCNPVFSVAENRTDNFRINPENHLLSTERITESIVRGLGYPFETYDVTTADGYILQLHRIPHGKGKLVGSVGARHRVPFIFLHGLYQDSSAFVSLGQNSSAFIFSDAGYDVWLMNLRGNIYSRRHTTLNPDRDYLYWDYCFNEMGNYDLPASMDLIVSITGERQVYLLGYSMGGAATTVFLSENLNYNENVLTLYLLAPAISLPQETHVFVYNFRLIERIFIEIMNNIEAAPYGEKMHLACVAACFGPLNEVCKTVLEYLMDSDLSHANHSTITSMISEFVSSVTMKIVSHFLQMVTSNSFAKYDYGKKNMEIYNQTTPPAYSIENITTDVTIFCALRDNLVNCTDMVATSQLFKRLVRISGVPLDGHTAFTHSQGARQYVYDVILEDISVTNVAVSVELDPSSRSSKLMPTLIITRTPDVFFVVPIAVLAVFVAILSTLYVRHRFLLKNAGEQVSLVSFTTRPPNYQGNN